MKHKPWYHDQKSWVSGNAPGLSCQRRRGGVHGTLRAQDSSRLRIQSLPYRPPGLPGKDYFRTTVFFPANFVTLLAVVWLDGEALFLGGNVYQTTLNCNITPNISSILQRLFHGGRTEAARQHDGHQGDYDERRGPWHGGMGSLGDAPGQSHRRKGRHFVPCSSSTLLLVWLL